MIDKFLQRKDSVLKKEDKSSIGGWDFRIKKLCEKINLSEDFCTTSSCSGRILLMIDQEKKAKDLFVFVSHEKVFFEDFKSELINSLQRKKNLKFKFEPCILHVSCRTLEDAEKIYEKAKTVGWKKSGIIGMKSGFVVELNSSERFEFPIVRGGKILVDDDFLKMIIEESNKKFEKVWKKIDNLEKLI